jgi:ion channel-forming bestrophin family protein
METSSASVYHALLAPQRLEALADCDKNLFAYDPNSFWMVFRIRGRHFKIILWPLLVLLLWDIGWGLYFIVMDDPLQISDSIQSMQSLITPILTPVSFLLVFRLGRAAVRYWDARAAMGKTVEVCRTLASTALIGCYGNHHEKLAEQLQDKHSQQLAEDFVRWIAAFPMAVKNFLRPFEGPDCKRAKEIGNVLLLEDRMQFLNVKSNPFVPILVLNRLRQLAFEASFAKTQHQPACNIGPALFQQLNEQIDLLTGAWGAMERINGTPLPFVYVVHLRTFLLLYLFLWHVEAIASYGWIALVPLLLASWGLLGIEAAAVCCERPFQWNSNHLALGKACIVISMNLAQTMENVGWTPISSTSTTPTNSITDNNTPKVE